VGLLQSLTYPISGYHRVIADLFLGIFPDYIQDIALRRD